MTTFAFLHSITRSVESYITMFIVLSPPNVFYLILIETAMVSHNILTSANITEFRTVSDIVSSSP